MHGAALFFILAFLVFFVYSTYSPTAPHKYTLEVPARAKEGFAAGAAAAVPCAAPNDPPGGLPTAPYGGISENVPRPAFDPALQPTTAARVKTVLDDLKGFQNFEMPQLEERSDPNVQLPLSTLKGDVQTLMNEALVLQRNPGLRPSITEQQMAEIEANLDYLRQVYRKFEGLGVVEPRRATKVTRAEGFSAQQRLKPTAAQLAEGFSAQQRLKPTAAQLAEGFSAQQRLKPTAAQLAEGFAGSCASASGSGACASQAPPSCASASGSGACASAAPTTSTDRPATLAELQEFRTWIFAERRNLLRIGATDEVTVARVNNLTKVITYLDNLIDKVDLGKMLEKNIPITYSDINSYKSLGSVGDKLPDWLSLSDLTTTLNNLFPNNTAGSPEIAAEIEKAIADYAKNFSKNFSWSIDLGMKYTADNETEAAKFYNSRANQGGNAGWTKTGLDNTSDATAFQPAGAGTGAATDEYANKPEECGRGPSRFDWKQRATDICRAIKGRGLDPNDYGCMEPGVSVGPNFSWRGYAKMVCTRVGTNYDSGLGQMVGCPPLNWPGWKV
jgi:hypothetical protein